MRPICHAAVLGERAGSLDPLWLGGQGNRSKIVWHAATAAQPSRTDSGRAGCLGCAPVQQYEMAGPWPPTLPGTTTRKELATKARHLPQRHLDFFCSSLQNFLQCFSSKCEEFNCNVRAPGYRVKNFCPKGCCVPTVRDPQIFEFPHPKGAFFPPFSPFILCTCSHGANLGAAESPFLFCFPPL